MILSNEEALETIKTLITKYVPACLDKLNIMEKLAEYENTLFVPPNHKCSKCQVEMVCPECGDFDITSDVTVRINGNIIYES